WWRRWRRREEVTKRSCCVSLWFRPGGSMHVSRVVSFFALVGAALGAVVTACGDDDALVRLRLDGGPDATFATDGSGEGGTLGCGVTLPTTYESASFATNAAIEIAMAGHFEAIQAKMKETEGTSSLQVAAADLKALYGEGAPSLRAVSTPA